MFVWRHSLFEKRKSPKNYTFLCNALSVSHHHPQLLSSHSPSSFDLMLPVSVSHLQSQSQLIHTQLRTFRSSVTWRGVVAGAGFLAFSSPPRAILACYDSWGRAPISQCGKKHFSSSGLVLSSGFHCAGTQRAGNQGVALSPAPMTQRHPLTCAAHHA